MSTATAKVSNDQRYTASRPCPICGGHEGMQRGDGKRCTGYVAASGKSAFCERVESEVAKQTATGTLYKHRIGGEGVTLRVVGAKGRKPAFGTLDEAATSYAAWSKKASKNRVPVDIGKPVKHWIYQHVEGPRHCAVVRFEREGGGEKVKTYRPFHVEARGWVSGDPDGLLPLYGLPELPTADLVVFVEGEKCADAARSLGFAGTTTMHGAKCSPDKSDFSILADASKTVVVIPDNDGPGREYAEAIAAKLSRLDPAPRIKLLDLPYLEPKADLADWAAADGTAEYLGDLIEAAEEYQSPEPRVEGQASGGKTPPPAGKATVDDADLARLAQTEFGLADRAIARFGHDLHYCKPWKKYLVYDGKRWMPDDTGAAMLRFKWTVDNLFREMPYCTGKEEKEQLFKWMMRCETRRTVSNVAELVSFREGIPVTPDQLDTDHWALNCPNGTVDLRTGELRPHRKSDLITKLCPIHYDPDARAPRWEQFEREIFAGDEGLIGYMRRTVGYALTGLDTEQEINILHGDGSNGKNAFLDTIKDLLGDYAIQAEPNLLLSSRSETHPTGVADLHGRRFVAASETDDGQRLAVALVKRLTGDGTIKARKMHQDFFSFQRTFKVFLATNFRPEITTTDHATWRRIRLVPFRVTFVKRNKPIAPPLVMPEDPTLKSKLEAEARGILALLVRGCLEWQRIGLSPPAAVIAATEDYEREMDRLKQFIDDCCFTSDDPSVKCQAKELYNKYVEWAHEIVTEPLSSRKFGTEMERRGHKLHKSDSKCWRLGIGLKVDL